MSRVALLHNLNRGESERQIEFDNPDTIAMLQGMIAERHDCQPIEATQDMSWISQLADYKPDIVFNVGEGFHGAAREAVYPAILEQLGVKYCGPDPTNLALTLNKHVTKELSRGIPGLEIPKSFLWSEELDPRALGAGRYMVKLMHEGSSIGMHLAETAEEVPAIALALQDKYRDNVLVEEYVNGTDISMAYVEGVGVLGPARVHLPDGEFYDHHLKSDRDSEVGIGAYEVAPHIKSKLQAVAAALVHRLDLKGYAKIDLRLDKDDDVHLIEVNAQVSFHPEGEFAHCCKADGQPLGNIVHSIIDNALRTDRRPSVGVKP